MPTSHLEVLVEEQSMEAALRGLLPKLLGATTFEIYPHQCKEELLTQLPSRLRGYSHFIPSDWRVMVVVDRDDDDCYELKNRLEQIAAHAKLSTRASNSTAEYFVVNRIAIEELEAWFFGDWDAVRTVYPKLPATIPKKAKYRDPDAITGGTWEAFERLCQQVGYFRNGLRKIEAATLIATQMNPAQNRSRSFECFRNVLAEMRIPG